MYPKSGLAINGALDHFLEAREGARRFHRDAIGKDVDPEHCFADWLSLVRIKADSAIEKKYWSKAEKTAMAESSGSAGGYTVPPELSLGMMRDLSTGSLLRRYGAYVQPMGSLNLTLPIPDVSTAYASGVSPYFGGFLMQWLAESQSLAQTGIQFRDVVLTAWMLGGYVYASNTFLADSAGVEVWLTRMFTNGAAYYQDYAFFTGSGVGQPMGIINTPGAVSVNRTTANEIVAADAQKMISQLLPSAIESGAIWFCSPSALAQITAFTGWFPNGPLMLYGFPVVPTGKLPALGNTGDLVLVVPSLYIIGDRMTCEIAFGAEEPGSFFNYQSAFRVYSRVDGQPCVAAPITDIDDNVVSPFVVLNANT